ncbi:MAG: hypothetical protein U1E36_05650 [Rickettsiales bacterium]
MKHVALFLILLLPAFCLAEESLPAREANLILNWLAATSETNAHQMNGAAENKLWVSQNGLCEAVHDKDGKLVQDGVNDGSFNYFHPAEQPADHFIYDVLPWIEYGNSASDKTAENDRINAYIRDLSGGLFKAAHALKKTFDLTTLTNDQKSVLQAFVTTIRDVKLTGLYDYLENPEAQAKELKPLLTGLFEPMKATLRKLAQQPFDMNYLMARKAKLESRSSGKNACQ